MPALSPPAATAERYAELYVGQGLSLKQVGALLGVSHQKAEGDLRRLGIAKRTQSEAARTRSVGSRQKPLGATETEYRRLYEDQGLSLRELGGRLGISRRKVAADLVSIGVVLRDPGELHRGRPSARLTPPALSEPTMRKLYVEERLGLNTISERTGVSKCKLVGDMKRAGITGRGPRKAQPVSSVEVLHDLYWKQGLSADEIAPIFGVSNHKIRLDMEALAIPRRPGGQAWEPCLSAAFLHELHEAGMSAVQIGEAAGVSMGRVRTDMRKQGLVAHYAAGRKRKTDEPQLPAAAVKVPTDAAYFDVIGDDQAYILGFVAADGCLTRDGRTVSIGLAASDRELLVQIQDRIGGSLTWRPPQREGRQALSILRLHSVRLWRAMASFGMESAKDRTLPRITAPAGHEAAFVRGLMDGDGSVAFMAGSGIPRVKFVNRNRSLIDAVSKVWEAISGETPGKQEWGNGYCSIYARAQASRKIAAELYLADPAALALARKREMAALMQHKEARAA